MNTNEQHSGSRYITGRNNGIETKESVQRALEDVNAAQATMSTQTKAEFTVTGKKRGEPLYPCPNCGQWQHPSEFGYMDCVNECVNRGFAQRTIPAEKPRDPVYKVRLRNGLALTDSMELERQRDEARKHADKLAAALRHCIKFSKMHPASRERADDVLAAWEKLLNEPEQPVV